ncbi:hypothetical protein ACFOLC_00115 [Lysobacter cavernae]|uniref:Nuclear transport factor 2 family protein n=1 Tax=Lysobacter cavernae TaxID=1685901 RepID=A0ABV7RJB6_9GAMM
MRKVVLCVLLAALASWYFHFGRKMTEDSVKAFYDMQTGLLAKLDGEPLCRFMAKEYHSSDVIYSGAGTERTELDREAACEHLKQGLLFFQKMSSATQGRVEPTFDQQVKNVSLSEGSKLATVEGVMTVKVGDILIGRTRFTERLVRRNGRIVSLGGESKTWMYGLD